MGNALRGVCMGVADVIPGVSGATVALILGIYRRLIDAVGSVGVGMLRRLGRRSFLAALGAGARRPSALDDTEDGVMAGHVLLLLSVAAGILPAIVGGARILPPLLGERPEEMRALFLGLVASSVAIPARGVAVWSADRLLLAAAAALLTVWFVGLPVSASGHDPTLAYVFLGGVLAVSAMALPGISGSFVLLLLGLYHFVLSAVADLFRDGDPQAAATVAVFVAAMAVGMLSVARALRALLARWRDATLAVLVGLMVGSLRKLWPFAERIEGGREALVLPEIGDPGLIGVAGSFAAGVVAVLALDAAGRRVGGEG